MLMWLFNILISSPISWSLMGLITLLFIGPWMSTFGPRKEILEMLFNRVKINQSTKIK